MKEELIKKVFARLSGPQMWGLTTTGQWFKRVKPILIQHDGRYFIMSENIKEEDKYVQDNMYTQYDFSNDIRNGYYVDFDLKVGEEYK